MTHRVRRHLRDAASICTATVTLSNGLVISRCERERGHGGKHKDGCSHWPATEQQKGQPR